MFVTFPTCDCFFGLVKLLYDPLTPFAKELEMPSATIDEKQEEKLLEKLFDLNDAIHLLDTNGEVTENMRLIIIASLQSEIEMTIATIKISRKITSDDQSTSSTFDKTTRLHS